jgi:hypothetical protein
MSKRKPHGNDCLRSCLAFGGASRLSQLWDAGSGKGAFAWAGMSVLARCIIGLWSFGRCEVDLPDRTARSKRPCTLLIHANCRLFNTELRGAVAGSFEVSSSTSLWSAALHFLKNSMFGALCPQSNRNVAMLNTCTTVHKPHQLFQFSHEIAMNWCSSSLSWFGHPHIFFVFSFSLYWFIINNISKVDGVRCTLTLMCRHTLVCRHTH